MTTKFSCKNKIEKECGENRIKISLKSGLIYISIYKKNSYLRYKTSYTLNELYSFSLFSNLKIEKIFEVIIELINKRKFKIEENKLILISNGKIELILNKKSLYKEKIINEINNLKEENIYIKEFFKKEIKHLKSKTRKKFEKVKNKNKQLEKHLSKLTKMLKEQRMKYLNKIRKMGNKIKKLEKNNNKNNQLTNSYMKKIKTRKDLHNNYIDSIGILPSGNFISISHDKSIKINNENLDTLQTIKNAHNDIITYVDIIDENNFITCSSDRTIRIWKKNNNKYELNDIINDAHDLDILKVIYCRNKKIISCSYDSKVKIWGKTNEGHYQNILILDHSDCIYSMLLLEDKKIFISAGVKGVYFWGLNFFNFITHIKETFCDCSNSLCRIGNDKIILQSNTNNCLKVISISKRIIIREIKNSFSCKGIFYIKDKDLFLVGGQSNDLKVFRCDNYECIQIIQNAQYNYIKGFNQLKNGNIVSYGYSTIKLWSF